MNRFVVGFLLFILIAFGVFWKALNSTKFLTFISEKIVLTLREATKSDISFSKVDISFFPPGIIINDLVVPKTELIPKSKTEIGLKKIEVYFDIFNLYRGPISISSLIVHSPKVKHFEKNKKVTKTAGPINKKTIEKYFKKYIENFDLILKQRRLYIKGIEINDLSLTLNKLDFNVPRFEVGLKNKKINLKVKLKNILFKDFGIYFKELNKDLEASEFELKVKLSKKDVEIDKIYINSKDFTLIGNGRISPLKKDYKVFVSSTINLGSLLGRKYKINKGFLSGQVDLVGNLEKYELDSKLKATEFSSSFLSLENVKADVYYKDDKLVITKLDVENNEEKLKLLKKATIYDKKENIWFPEKYLLNLTDVKTKTALKFVDDVLYPLSAEVNGNLEISYKKNELFLQIKDQATVKDLKVHIDGTDIINVKKVNTNNLNFAINIEQFRIGVKGNFAVNNSKLSIDGYLNDDHVHFDVKSLNEVKIQDFGAIANQNFQGNGNVSIKVRGFYDDINFTINTDVENGRFEAIKLDLGHVKGDINLSLGKSRIKFLSMQGKSGNSEYNLLGNIYFKDSLKMNLYGESTLLKYEDFKNVFKEIIADVDLLPETVWGDFIINYKIILDKDNKLRVQVNVLSNKIEAYGELFTLFTFDLLFVDDELRFSNIVLNKDEGTLSGNANYNIEKREYELKLLLNKLPLNELTSFYIDKLNIIGLLKGEFSATGKKNSLTIDSKLKMYQTKIGNEEFPDSHFTFKFENNLIKSKLNLLGDLSNVDLLLDVANIRDKASSIKFDLKANDLKTILNVISRKNVSDKLLYGNLKLTGSSKFSLVSFADLDFDLEIEDFYLNRKNINAFLTKEKNKIIIKNGQIKKWDIDLRGDGLTFSTIGRGNFKNNYNLQSKLKVDASVFETLIERLVTSEGNLDIHHQISNRKNGDNKKNVLFNSKARKILLNIEGLPGKIEDADVDLYYNNGTLYLEKFSGIYEKGKFNGLGTIKFDKKSPIFDVNYEVQNTNINLFNKSNFQLSGKGKIQGSSTPYLVTSDFYVHSGNLLDELESIASKNGGVELVNTYLPSVEKRVDIPLFKFDLNISDIKNVDVRNSLANLKLQGNLRLVGDLKDFKMGGQLNLVKNSGKFFLKGHDFVLKETNIKFFENEKEINPEIQVEGKARISDYDIVLAINGRASDYKVQLTSVPELSEESIFSLLILGYTDETLQNIEYKDRDSLTSLGVSTILFDKFKINKEINSLLGLNVSVEPELIESDTTLLPTRASDEGGVSTVKSATKINLRKKVSKEVSVSFSSIVGAGSDEKQEMNLNYDFNKNISATSVYEIKSSEGVENQDNLDSAGVDLKFRWTFK